MMNATTLTIGTRLRVKVNSEIVEAVYTGPSENPEYGQFDYNGHSYPRSFSRVENLNPGWNASSANTVVVADEAAPAVEAAPRVDVAPTFDVNTRFKFIERMVDMIVRDQEKSLVVTGSGGLGKSFTVFNRLKHNDLGEADYDKVSGHMTPKALYRCLHEANGKVVVFDDCDSVLVNDTATNLLKAALDSYGPRTLHWRSEMGGGTDELPRQFDFTGRVIFISNFSLQDFPQPVVSRALYVDVTMTPDEKIERIAAIAPSLVPDMSDTDRQECLNLINLLRYQISDLNLRTMLKVASIRRANPVEWRDMATYMVTARLSRTR